MTNLKKLRRLAEQATPGPWQRLPMTQRGGFRFGENQINVRGTTRTVVTWGGFDGSAYSKTQARRNAAYIAAIDPTTLLALLDAVDAVGVEVKDGE